MRCDPFPIRRDIEAVITGKRSIKRYVISFLQACNENREYRKCGFTARAMRLYFRKGTESCYDIFNISFRANNQKNKPVSHTEGYRSGHNEAVLKTVWGQPRVGSNPTPSAIYFFYSEKYSSWPKRRPC